jgi:hypothetical protein
MSNLLPTELVWESVAKEQFAVLGMVNAHNEARTVGIIYLLRDRRLYIATDEDAWKVAYIRQNPNVSLTIPIHKSIPLMPWIKIPAATITFAGLAEVLEPADLGREILRDLYRQMADDEVLMAKAAVIEVTPIRDFLTYGVGVPLMDMRDPAKARGRAPVGTTDERVTV